MTSKWGLVPILLFGLAVFLPAENSRASLIYEDTFYLNIFTNNGAYANDPGMSLFVDIFLDDNDNGDANDDLVYFEFHNDSSTYCSIAAIYFDDNGALLSGLPDIINGPGTFFINGGTPPVLPAGNELIPTFQKPPDAMASADEPAPTNGINPTVAPDPDEWMTVVFDLVDGNNVNDVATGLEDHSLRIGAHIIAFPDGSSEAAVTIPEPASLGLILLGGLALFRGRRRFRPSR